MFEYTDIKLLAAQTSRSVKEMLAMSLVNDPFYAGQPGRREKAEWFGGIWQSFGFQHGAHLRRIHYQLVSAETPVAKPNGEPYRNTENDWQLLVNAGRDARYFELIPAGALVDRRNAAPQIFTQPPAEEPDLWVESGTFDSSTWLRLPEFPTLPWLHVSDYQGEQDYLTEVWIEKSTQNDWLIPLCRKRGANLVVGVGELSEIACRQLVQRIERTEKPVRIFYLSDFDPAGRSMPVAVARKMEFYLKQWDLAADVTLQPVILTEEQCQDYDLPRTPIKNSERRKDTFEGKFGSGATELDALEALYPGKGREVVDREICRYFDTTLWERTIGAGWQARQAARQVEEDVHEVYSDEIEALEVQIEDINRKIREAVPKELFDEWKGAVKSLSERIEGDLEEEKPDLDDYPVPGPRPAEEPDEEPLFDSKRDYFTQLDHYHDWQRR